MTPSGQRDNGNHLPSGDAFPSLFPSSSLQKELWRLQHENTPPQGNVPLMVTLAGPLNVKALVSSLEHLLMRHEMLRTVFTFEQEQLMLRVLPAWTPELRQIDLSGSSRPLIDLEIERIIEQERTRIFDSENAPLWNALLLRLGASDARLFITFHRLIIDEPSISHFVSELALCHEAFSRGVPPELPSPRASYGHFALQQNRSIESGSFDPQLEYWKRTLKDCPFTQEIPGDLTRPALQTFSGARHRFGLDPQLSNQLNRWCRQNGCSPEAFFLAIFQTLIHRYSGRSCIITGVQSDHRNGSAEEQLIGNFANKLPLRTDFDAEASFTSVLAQVGSKAREAFEHGNVPFELIPESLGGEGDRSRHPVFQNLFIFRNQPETSFRAGDIDFRYETLPGGTVPLDLQLQLNMGRDSFDAWIDYNTDLFKSSTIQRFATDFAWAAAHAQTNPEMPVGAWQLPSVPVIGCDLADPGHGSCCHHLVEVHARANPDHPAIISGTRQLTYRELDAAAGRLASLLVARGITADTPVGLCMNRSPEMCIGILGILKAGGAYLPLDPAYPEERLRFMITDSGMRLALTDQATAESLTCGELVELLLIDRLPEMPAAEPPASRIDSSNLAYMMYTSGSTGTPKGVMITHGNVVSFALSAVARYGITASDRVLQFFSVSFDGSIEEIFTTWAAGGTLVLRDFPVELTADDFFRQIDKYRISVIDLPTAFWHELVNSIRSDRMQLPGSLRLVIIGGEQASLPIYRKWRNLFGDTPKLINTYGPTETTVVALCADPATIDRLEEHQGGLPIGTPLDNTCIAVVSESLNLMPFGMPGELLIGGTGVARGYLNRPELNREKFIEGLPHRAAAGGRFYRTGDLVRFLEDGNLLFLGRTDHQVKIRGFRIEPTGIEAQLNLHPSVKNSAVIDYKDNAGQSFLVAYILPETTAPAPGELKSHLSKQLPDYMVPPHFICLDAFPMLPNGKINRNGFPPLELESTRQERPITPPSSELEGRLVEIWEQVLGISPIGIDDNFFDLGGHSLMAVRLCASINEQLQTSLTLSGLFQNLTIETLARQLKKNKPQENLQGTILMQPGAPFGTMPPLFFIHVLGTGLKFCRPMVTHLGKELPVYALSVQLLQESPLKENSIEELAAFYIGEIKKIVPEGPYLFVGISFGGMVIFEMARQLEAANDDVRLVGLMDTIPPWAYTTLDSSSRLKEHGARLREEGVGYLARKIQDRLTHEREMAIMRLKNFQNSLTLSYYLKSGRADQMPVGIKEFAARQENDEASARYSPAPYKGKVTLFKSLERSSAISVVTDHELGWSRFALGGVEIIDCPSDHLGMLSEPYVRTVAEQLSQCITRSLSEERETGAAERFRIRPIRTGDGQLLKTVTLRSVQESPDAFVITLEEIHSNPDAFWENLADFIASSKQDEIYLLFDNGQCIGYSGGHIDSRKPGTGHLRWMWVDPASRGHGLGSKLIKKIVDWAKQKGAREMELWVSQTQEAAIGAYRSNGFRLTGDIEAVRPGSTIMSKKMIRDITTET
ncbi:MAG: amino acid adenylation domain-containing protein [Chlorobiaceae bacterium]|nr:amino acid adenylation domain-containing protein [Chlorobiaceae bacterium]